MGSKRIQVECPCCHSKMEVDPETGLVLKHERQKPRYSLEEALEREKDRKGQADDLFQKAFDDEKTRSDNLEKKFREAFDSQDELEDPTRPFDLD